MIIIPKDKTIIYADLNCPFCFVLNEWLALIGLESTVHWQGIEHEIDLNLKKSLTSHEQDLLDEEVSNATQRGQGILVSRPKWRPNSKLALAALEKIRKEQPIYFVETKRRLYRALWVDGKDISDPEVLSELLKDVPINGVDDLQGELLEVDEVTKSWRSEKYDRIPMAKSQTGALYLGMGNIESFRSFLNSGLFDFNAKAEVCVIENNTNENVEYLETYKNLTKLPFLKAMIEQTKELLFLCDESFNVHVCNSAVANFFGSQVHQIIGKSIYSLFKVQNKDEFHSHLINDDSEFRISLSLKDKEHHFAVSSREFLDNEKSLRVLSFRDIDVHLQNEKLESISATVSAYNHEINNPLFIAISAITLIRKGTKVEKHLDVLEDALYRIKDIIYKTNNITQSKIEFEKYCNDSKMLKIK